MWRLARLLPLLALLALSVPGATVDLNSTRAQIAYRVSPVHFDYIGWELGAIGAKLGQLLFGLHAFMSEAERSDFVRAYMDRLATAQRLEAEVTALYSDPGITDPDSAAAELISQRDALRDQLADDQALTEAILEGQVASVLVEMGFGLAGQLLPPMAMRFTQTPNLLLTSPRDEIRMDIAMNINPMPIDAIDQLEETIMDDHEVSVLVVPIGGMALYPSMILETTSIEWSAETFAHEWAHHYLTAFPLGLNYFTGGDTRTINETTAELFGIEVGRVVLERYYPERVPAPQPAGNGPAAPATPDPDAFDFGQAMHETRITVDAMLAEGRVDAAERYMEQRRQLFFEEGYRIRKLNQAYFAFYGGYQSGTLPGVGGEDEIGPAVRDIRDQSASLHDFLVTMRGVVTREDLLAVRAEVLATD